MKTALEPVPSEAPKPSRTTRCRGEPMGSLFWAREMVGDTWVIHDLTTKKCQTNAGCFTTRKIWMSNMFNIPKFRIVLLGDMGKWVALSGVYKGKWMLHIVELYKYMSSNMTGKSRKLSLGFQIHRRMVQLSNTRGYFTRHIERNSWFGPCFAQEYPRIDLSIRNIKKDTVMNHVFNQQLYQTAITSRNGVEVDK